MSDKDNKVIGVSLDPKIVELLEDNSINKSKLVNTLLDKHFTKENLK